MIDVSRVRWKKKQSGCWWALHQPRWADGTMQKRGWHSQNPAWLVVLDSTLRARQGRLQEMRREPRTTVWSKADLWSLSIIELHPEKSQQNHCVLLQHAAWGLSRIPAPGVSSCSPVEWCTSCWNLFISTGPVYGQNARTPLAKLVFELRSFT